MELDQTVLKRLLQKEDPVMLELGAHRGEDSKRFLKEFESIRIYCFEPDPRCIRKFKANIRDRRCSLIEAAVSNVDGRAILNMSQGWPLRMIPKMVKALGLGRLFARLMANRFDYASSIKVSVSNSNDNVGLVFRKGVEVRTIRLDSWIKRSAIESIDFIWADIQGAERDMIEGASETLRICSYLYIEYGEVDTYPEAMTRDETIALLQQHRYSVMPEYSSKGGVGNLLFKNEIRLR